MIFRIYNDRPTKTHRIYSGRQQENIEFMGIWITKAKRRAMREYITCAAPIHLQGRPLWPSGRSIDRISEISAHWIFPIGRYV